MYCNVQVMAAVQRWKTKVAAAVNQQISRWDPCQETPYLLSQDHYPSFFFAPPLPYLFDLVHMQFICFFGTVEQLFTQRAFTWLLDYQ